MDCVIDLDSDKGHVGKQGLVETVLIGLERWLG